MTQYRYTLTRSWEGGEGVVCWVCLNPSTKPEDQDTPTRRKIIAVSKREGFSSLVLVNLYAAPTPYARLLYKHPAPRGPDNNWFVEANIKSSDAVIFAWGGFGFTKSLEPPTDAERYALIHSVRPMCLGRTLGGQPRHPLYSAKNQLLELYWPEGYPKD